VQQQRRLIQGVNTEKAGVKRVHSLTQSSDIIFTSNWCKYKRLVMTIEPIHEAICRAFIERGELAGIAEFQRHFPRINASVALECVQKIVGRHFRLNCSAPEID